MTSSLSIVGGDLDVLVGADGRVVASGDGVAAGRAAATLDASGARVFPGFIDLQCNGVAGIDLTAAPERLWEVAAILPRFGITAWLPTIVSSPAATVDRAVTTLADRPEEAAPGTVAEPLGLHLEGPFLSPEHRGAHDRRYLAVPADDSDRAAGWSRDAGVAMVTLAPELPGALELAQALLARGVVVAAGHSGATAEQAAAAGDAGITMVTHLFNAMAPLHHRSPGLAGTALADRRWHCGVIVDGVHLDPQIVAIAWAALGARLVLVTDSVAALDAPPGPIHLGELIVEATSGTGVHLPDGTLAGSDLSMDRAVRNLVEFTGCSVADAAAAASGAPAEVLGIEDRGHLRPGAVGDVAVLTPAGRPVATVIGGTVAWRL